MPSSSTASSTSCASFHSAATSLSDPMAVDAKPANDVPPQANLRSLLSESQWEGFLQFRKSCAHLRNANNESQDHECRDGIDDDATLLRFFQARRCDPAKAYAHFEEACCARDVNDIGELYRKIDSKSFEETAALYPRWTGRRDKRGLPIYMFTLSDLTPARISAHKSSSDKLSGNADYGQTSEMAAMNVRRACVVHEHLTRFVFPLCTCMHDRSDSTPVTKQLIIADISGVSVGKVWGLRNYIREFSSILSTNYPEVLDRVLIIGAPHYTSTLFNLVRKLVDPGTAEKLVILGSKEIFPTLSKLMDVENIPKRYGGKFDVAPEMWPSLDRGLIETLTWKTQEKQLPSGPMLLLKGQQGSRVAVAVDSSNEKGQVKEVAVLGMDQG